MAANYAADSAVFDSMAKYAADSPAFDPAAAATAIGGGDFDVPEVGETYLQEYAESMPWASLPKSRQPTSNSQGSGRKTITDNNNKSFNNNNNNSVRRSVDARAVEDNDSLMRRWGKGTFYRVISNVFGEMYAKFCEI